jgi:hypothetical protein
VSGPVEEPSWGGSCSDHYAVLLFERPKRQGPMARRRLFCLCRYALQRIIPRQRIIDACAYVSIYSVSHGDVYARVYLCLRLGLCPSLGLGLGLGLGFGFGLGIGLASMPMPIRLCLCVMRLCLCCCVYAYVLCVYAYILCVYAYALCVYAYVLCVYAYGSVSISSVKCGWLSVTTSVACHKPRSIGCASERTVITHPL